MNEAAFFTVGINVAFGVRVTRDVEPVTAPALAVARRRQQTVHYARERFGRRVSKKRIHLFRCRRQAGQIVSGAPNQGALVRRGRCLQAFLFESGNNEIINRCLQPAGITDLGNGRFFRGLERPMPPAFGFRLSAFGFAAARVGRAQVNPRHEVCGARETTPSAAHPETHARVTRRQVADENRCVAVVRIVRCLVIGRATRREVHATGLWHRAVHVIVFNGAGRVFLQKRCDTCNNARRAPAGCSSRRTRRFPFLTPRPGVLPRSGRCSDRAQIASCTADSHAT